MAARLPGLTPAAVLAKPAVHHGDKRQEEVVDDRGDPFRGKRFHRHEDVVAHQVEGHRENRGGEPVQVDLAALMSAAEDLISELNRTFGCVRVTWNQTWPGAASG